MTTAANLAALGNGPTFSARLSGNQTISNSTTTKIQFATEVWDTNGNYDPTTNYRFTPTVAGYYQVALAIRFNNNGATQKNIYCGLDVTKNGTRTLSSYFSVNTNSSANEQGVYVNGLIYMNGSTDYLESQVYFYDYTLTTSTALINDAAATYFQAFLARAA